MFHCLLPYMDEDEPQATRPLVECAIVCESVAYNFCISKMVKKTSFQENDDE